MEIIAPEISSTKTKQMDQQQPTFLKIPSEDLKTGKKFVKDNRGIKRRVKLFYVASTKMTLVKMDDEYAKYSGYRNRVDMLTDSGQLGNSEHLLVHDPETDHIYVLLRVANNSQILN